MFVSKSSPSSSSKKIGQKQEELPARQDHRIWLVLTLFLILRLLLYQPLEYVPGEMVRVTGRVTNYTCQSISKCSFSVGMIDIFTNSFTPLVCGQKITVFGTLAGRVIGGQMINFALYDPKITVLAESSSSGALLRFRCWAEGVRNSFLAQNRKGLAGLPLSVLNGIAWGQSAEIDPIFLQKLKSTGTLHLLVASGYNVTVVFGAVNSLCRGFIRRRRLNMIALLVLWWYVFMAGFEPSIIRAGLMATVVLVAEMTGRKRDFWWTLILAAFLMVCISPGLLTDLSFQFSFLATAGLVYGQYFLNRWRVPRLIQPALVGVWAQLAVLPVSWRVFHTFSFTGLVGGPFLGLIVPPMTVGGFFLPLVSFALPGLVKWAAFPLWLLAKMFIAGVSFFSQFGGQIVLNTLTVPLMVGYYLFWFGLGLRAGVWGRDAS